MASSTAPTIDATGISAPSYASILAYLQAQYQAIFGADVYLAADSQDGQFLAIVAAAINDANQTAVAVYNSFSPATAQGAGLSSVVKVNGIARLGATNSTVDLTLTGTAGTTITNGYAADSNGNTWALPSPVTIPSGGSITVTATCSTAGAIAAAAGTVTKIQTPTFGWQSVTNAAAAAVGQAAETDAALRLRQQTSVALPSLSLMAGIVGTVEAISGVQEVVAYENMGGATDSNGLPGHSISLVVSGGDSTSIAKNIAAKKTPGCGTYGTTSIVVTDPVTGVPETINFYRPTPEPIAVAISLHALSGYTTAIAAEIQAAVAAYINALAIGQPVMISRLYVPAQLAGAADSLTFEIVSIAAAIKPGTPGTTDIAIAFNQTATCQASDVTITVV